MSEKSQNRAGMNEASSYRFGTFELDARSGELRRNGVKLRLQEQPFLVLRKLLEGSGGLVTREELHAALWPADTFVDFDTSLNTAIKRLREALGDSADAPVFIETVPRRGYRFLAPVQALRNGAGVARVDRDVEVGAAKEPVQTTQKRSWRFALLAGGVVLLLAAAGFALTWRSSGQLPRITDSTQLTFDGLGKGSLCVGGGYIYFNELLPDGKGIGLVRVPTAGGVATILDASVPGLLAADLSRDGSKLLLGAPEKGGKGHFENGLQLKIMDMSTSSMRDLGTTVGTNASWGPGSKIVFCRGAEIYLADGDLSHQQRLLKAKGLAYHVRFSPDGQKIRFTVSIDSGFSRTLWEARADGSGLHEMFPNWAEYADQCCGEWTPDGKYFFFQTRRNGAARIWAMAERPGFWSSASRAPVMLSAGPPNLYMGAPSPDGKKLYVTAAEPRAELVRYEARAAQFVPYLGGISAGDLEGSRDGQWVVYVKYPELTLWRAKADGTGATQLTGPSLRVALPHWSPDGKWIAFSGARPGGPWNIYLIAAAGGPAQQITNGKISDLDATWSPDGNTLAFGQRRAEGGKFTFSIQFLDLGTRSVSELANTDGICCPRWSPDGRFLLASHEDYDDLLLYEFVTHKWRVLHKEDSGYIGYMEWTSDNKYVVFDTFEAKAPGFYRVRVSDGHLDTITSTQDIPRFYGEFGPWTGMAPDGSPVLVRDISNEEVYALDLQLP